jgi:hypothetical protein
MKALLLQAGALAVLCLAVSACDDTDNAVGIAGPSSFRNQLEFVPITPAVLAWPGSPPLTCAGPLPGTWPFTLSVSAGASAIMLSEVRIHTSDPFRSTAPPTIFDSSSLTRQFASATVSSFSTRQFLFTHRFNCGIAASPVLFLSVTTTELDSGVRHTSSLQMPMR